MHWERWKLMLLAHPKEGLDFIEKISTKSPDHTILFLDINMPRINGWEFLDQYEKFSEEVKMQINIYMPTSSVDRPDKEKAQGNKNVKGFLSKPLDYETIISLSEKVFSSTEQ